MDRRSQTHSGGSHQLPPKAGFGIPVDEDGALMEPTDITNVFVRDNGDGELDITNVFVRGNDEGELDITNVFVRRNGEGELERHGFVTKVVVRGICSADRRALPASAA